MIAISLILLSMTLGWIVGMNDTGYILGTVIGSGLMSWKKSVLVAASFLLLGATFGGMEVLKNVSALVPSSSVHTLVFYVSSVVTMTIMNSLDFPAPASQVVVGSIFGLTMSLSEFHVENLSHFFRIFISWYTTPFLATFLGYLLYRILSRYTKRIKNIHHQEELFRVLTLMGIAYGSYSFGANNVANVVAPLVRSGIDAKKVIVLGGVSIVFGMLCCGRKSANKVGKSILELDYLASLVVIFSQAITVWFFSSIGIPVSTSQAIIGGILGVGRARGMKLESRGILLRIFGIWFLAPFASGLISFILVKVLIRFW